MGLFEIFYGDYVWSGFSSIHLSVLGAGQYLSTGGGGGLGNLRGSWKKSTPNGGGQNFIYESMGAGGHKYDFHFLFWHQNALASGEPPVLSLIFLIFHAPLLTTTTGKCYAYTEMPSVKFFCGNAHRHLIIRKYRQMHIDTHGKYFNKLLIPCWTEWNAGMEPTFQQAYGNQRPMNLQFNQNHVCWKAP